MAHFNLTAATPNRSKFTFLIATSPSSSPSKPTYTFTANPTKAGTTADLENENFTLHLQHPPNQPLNLHILECSFFKTHVNPATSYRRLCARRDTRVFRHICLRWPAQTQTTSDTPASPYELDVLVPAPMEVSANAANGSRIEAKMHHADGATQEAPPRPTEATSTITGGEQVGDDGAEGVQQPIQIMHHMSTLPRQGTVFRPRLYTIYTYPTAAGDLPLVPLTAAVPARPEYWTGEERLLRGVKAWDFDGRVLTEGEYALCTRTRTWTEEVGKRSRAVLRGMCVVM